MSGNVRIRKDVNARPVPPPPARFPSSKAVSVMQTDVTVEAVDFGYEDFRYRTPIKFGGVALDRVTLLNVRCTVRTRDGRSAEGRASMPLGNVWAFPSKRLTYADTLGAMKDLAGRVATLTA